MRPDNQRIKRSSLLKYAAQRYKLFGVNFDCELHSYASIGSVEKMRNLIIWNRKVDVNSKDEDYGDRTALHIACGKGFFECCKVLLKNGADPSMKMYQGWTPAHCAAEIGNVDIIRLIIEYSGNVLSKDMYGVTPKDVADTYGHNVCRDFLAEIENRENIEKSKTPEITNLPKTMEDITTEVEIDKLRIEELQN